MHRFLLTRPSRDVTNIQLVHHVCHNISTHTPLAGRDKEQMQKVNAMQISTHTPLAGRDREEDSMQKDDWNFYSHAPRGT